MIKLPTPVWVRVVFFTRQTRHAILFTYIVHVIYYYRQEMVYAKMSAIFLLTGYLSHMFFTKNTGPICPSLFCGQYLNDRLFQTVLQVCRKIVEIIFVGKKKISFVDFLTILCLLKMGRLRNFQPVCVTSDCLSYRTWRGWPKDWPTYKVSTGSTWRPSIIWTSSGPPMSTSCSIITSSNFFLFN